MVAVYHQYEKLHQCLTIFSIIQFFYTQNIVCSTPQIITKSHNITAIEGRTVTLPCAVKNMRPVNHVIWQHGLSGSIDQTLLTIGNTQIEKNYRIRIRNDDEKPVGKFNRDLDEVSSYEDKISAFNLEIRKLQLNDSGWYECQLNTRPTIKNYIYLNVIHEPKIYHHPSKPELGDTIEIFCEIKSGSDFEVFWTKNDRLIMPDQRKILAHSKTMLAQNHNSNGDVSYKIKNLNSEHKKVSKLTIKNLYYEDEGIYKCVSDGGIQTVFQLELPKVIGKFYHKKLSSDPNAALQNQKNLKLLSIFSISLLVIHNFLNGS